MKPVRLPTSSNAEGTDTKSVGASPKFFSNMFSGGRHRRPSLSGEPLGCLSLLDAGEQIERPRAFPSPGLAGEVLPSCSLKVHAQPTIEIQRPRAILSSPENDELQGQQVEKLTTSSSMIKAAEAISKDLPSAPVSSADLIEPLPPSKEVPKAVVSPPDELLYMGDMETSISDEASCCSTSSNAELHSNELLLAHELLDIKLSRTLTAEALKEKKFVAGLPEKSRHEQNGNEENLGNGSAANRLLKKHSGAPSVTPPRLPKQQSSSPLARKGNSGRVLRPWY